MRSRAFTASVLADPALPGFAAIVEDAASREYGTVVRVLAHRPGRRVTLLLEPGLPGTAPPRVVKLFCRSEFAAALAVNRAAARHDGLAPAMVAVDPGSCLIELEHIEGVGLDTVDPHERRAALQRLGPELARVHGSATPGLPAWDAGHPGRKLRRALDAAAAAGGLPGPVLRSVRAAADALDARTATSRAAASVHGDTALRNVFVTPGGEVRLLDWDRSARGPAEVDLAPFVGLLGADADPLLAGYRAAGGRVDAERLADLVAANRATRALRRFASGRDDAATVSARVRAAVEQLLERDA